ncbi:hypothetical protein ERUR111494_05730 [Erysipelothrix urinaevulpis]|uniref:hypothetical protein n=1 Tax=Erysipelothrix urinaevulpis TaxID=2683717 RepID=UPI0013586BC2|nr:hypothetical protein [Erysipelothrix urinaevulpis]
MWDDQQSQLVLSLRLKQLKRRGLEGLTVEDLEKVFDDLYRIRKISSRLSDRVDLVFNTTDDEIVRVLAIRSQKEAYGQTLQDFKMLMKNED